MPGAVVKLADGSHEAIELEIATKARLRYLEKIRFYLDLIRDSATRARASYLIDSSKNDGYSLARLSERIVGKTAVLRTRKLSTFSQFF